MPFQPIAIGASPNDGQGDPLRNAMAKANANFVELYAQIAALGGNAQVATGILPSFPFELLGPALPLGGGHGFELPRFPLDFIMHSVYLTTTRRTDAQGDVTINANLRHMPMNAQLAVINGQLLPANGILPMAITAQGNRISGGVALRIDVQTTDSEAGYGGVSSGLCLWIRGVWA